MAQTIVLKIDAFSQWDGTFPIEPPSKTEDWEIVSADVKTNPPTSQNDNWITKVAVVWRQKSE